jgi:hypothetical protein
MGEEPYLSMTEEQRVRVLENRVLRLKKDEITRDGR